jgi:excinuclease ABC subunit A
VFTPIRDLFAMLPESRERGYKPGRFSFNVKGGRCEACQGDGLKRIEMNFLPDVYVTCDVCRGRRYNHETLQVKYKGRSIADLLDSTVEEALGVLENIPQIRPSCRRCATWGWATSPGAVLHHPFRRRGAAHQAGPRTEPPPDRPHLLHLDEPTTGLHFDDVRKLLDVLQRLVDLGNTVVVIEHNLDVIKTADWIVDLGPDGGEYGGRVVAAGPPEQICRSKKSYTAEALRKVLENGRAVRVPA